MYEGKSICAADLRQNGVYINYVRLYRLYRRNRTQKRSYPQNGGSYNTPRT